MHHLRKALQHMKKAREHLYQHTDEQGSSVAISHCRNRLKSAIQKTYNHAKKQEQTRHVQGQTSEQVEA
jgi:site-specific recombinase